jgi:hypothetical protein
MIKASKAIMIALAGLASLYGLGVPAASSQGYYDQSDYGALRRYNARPDGWYDNGQRAEPYGYSACHSVIRATGIGYPFGIGSRYSAIKAWQREAWSFYGHDFAWSRAEEPNIECAPYLATIRCTASARPCS